jgi:hypothetical protein
MQILDRLTDYQFVAAWTIDRGRTPNFSIDWPAGCCATLANKKARRQNTPKSYQSLLLAKNMTAANSPEHE